MPKVPPKSPEAGSLRRHNPLTEEYSPTQPFKQKSEKRRKISPGEKTDEDDYIDSKASQSILRIGQDLVEEDVSGRQKSLPNPAFAIESRSGRADDVQEGKGNTVEDEDEAWGDEVEVVEEVDVDPNDQDIFNRFNPASEAPSNLLNATSLGNGSIEGDEAEGAGETTNLADLILEKIAAHEAATKSQDPNQSGPQSKTHPFMDAEEEPLPPKVIEVYTKVGSLLSRHRSGPLPKPFKILPTLPLQQIPQILDLTNPQSWTPHAHFLAARLFISAKPYIAQPYLREILLPRVRDEISETKKLHVHLYNALKKSLYKPACFFKGLIFPLLQEGDCTLKEAQIIGSAITRVSVPVLHSAAALLKLCDIAAEQFSVRKEDGGGGAINIFIRVLLEKKYALPFQTIDALVFHFVRFKALKTAERSRNAQKGGGGDIDMDKEEGRAGGPRLPVLWHQSFLSFAQRYRNDITEDQREALMDVVANVGHRTIGPEIRRELLQGRGRGVPAKEGDGAILDGGDDTMMLG